ncbi:MAG: hypothetical protein FJW32_07235, partial [Acidobacteria bacterium]|nr:hypothetical protein [Acidobacteriota bacterium]
MVRRLVIPVLACLSAFAADPVIGPITIKPTFIPPNTTTQVTITAQITDTTLLANGANVQRLNAAGGVAAVLGNMRDDGLNGDAVANDRIFTLVFPLNAPAGRVAFRTTGAFPNLPARVPSSSIAIDSGAAATPLTIDGSAAPAPNATGWNRQDVTVTFACSGGAGGAATCPAIVRVTADGAAQPITGTATDGSGNTATKTVPVNLDRTPPVLAITSPPNGSIVATPVINLAGTATDATSGIATFTCNGQAATLNGPNFTCNLPLAPGANAITVQATDVAGNTATAVTNVVFSVTTLTLTSAASPLANTLGWNNTNVSVTFTCAGGALPVNCPQNLVVSTEGANQVIARTATDALNSTATTSVTLKIDKTPPVLTVTTPPAASAVTNAQLTVSGTATDTLSGLSRVLCNGAQAALNGGAFTCNLTLANGLNNIAIQAFDNAGNIATVNRAVTLGNALTISSTQAPPPNAVGWNNANVTITYACAGGVAPVTCPQPASVTTEGASQVITRTATDAGGGSATATNTIKLDKTGPVITATAPPTSATANITITGTVTDPLSGLAAFTCNGTPAAVTQSNFTCDVKLNVGANAIVLQAADIAGNTSASSLPVAYTAPKLLISAAPAPAPNAAGWNNTNVTVSFTCSGGVGTITCPQPVAVTTEGANQTIQRTANDTGGNSASASVTLRIDKTAPAIAVTSPSSGSSVPGTQVTLNGTASDTLSGIATVRCNAVTAALTPGGFSCTVTLNPGANTINLQATDVAGNTTAITHIINSGSNGLSILLSANPPANAAGWNSADVNVTATCSGGFGALTCPAPLTVSTEGANQVITRTVTDSVNNSASASVTLRIDKSLPLLAVTSPANGATVLAAQVTVTGTINDPLSGLASVRCNNITAILTPGNFSCDVPLVAGANTVNVQALDLAGNAANASITVNSGTGGLSILLSANPLPNAAGWNNADVTVTSICSGGIGAVTCPPPLVVSAESASQVITRTASDSAGNSVSASLTLKLDKTVPALAITLPPANSTTINPQVTVTGNASDALSGLASVTCNGNAATLNAGGFTCGVTLSLGPNTVTVLARDIAGNTATATLPLTLAPPLTISFTSPANLSYLNLSPTTVNGTVSDSAATMVINGITTPVNNGAFSAQIPLAEGPNILTATGTLPSGATATASLEVTLDTTPPRVTITNPPDKFVTTDDTIAISGSVNDIVAGTVNDQQAVVTVNGLAAQVANRTFLASAVALAIGDNVITAVGRDRSGNSASTQITITRQAPAPVSRIRVISGNNQSGVIGSALGAPTVVALTDGAGNPVANKPVIFKVTQNDGLINSGAATAIVNSNAQGQAQVNWALGFRAGAGGNTMEAYAVGFTGTALFTATGTQGPAGKIVVDSGNGQIGVIGQGLPKPLLAVVVDAGNNRLPGVSVTFRVMQGGGSFNGQQTYTATSDSDGRVAASLTLGFQEGNDNNLVEASFVGNQGYPAAFTASGRAAGNPAQTVISGVVLDNSNAPIPGVTVRAVLTNLLNSNSGVLNSVAAVQTNAKEKF